ncbi:MAG: polysaccharide deacetylase family protein [Alistipes sp.]|nr:polysaccharide deacetylase family protein [Alistipes sp.]MBQ3248801.1 polysaccharide deacetylase family protein [Alistipes sp.]MBR3826446.1 polysaccharide deacetylase family protein [Alistipes sp.]
MRINPGTFLRWMFPGVIWSIDDPEGIYLTFDDGPTPGVTEWILQTLDRYNAKATFFVLGKNVELYPDLYQMIIDRGHKVGNHTYSHQKGWRMSLERYIEDVDLAGDMIHTELFRPPYAQITRSQLRQAAQRYRVVMWNVLSRDYNRKISPKKCLRGTIKGLRGGDIISLHDSAKSFRNTSYVLPALLRTARERGLTCKILEL